MTRNGDRYGDTRDRARRAVDIEAALVWAYMTEAAGSSGAGAEAFLGWRNRSGDGCSMDGERVQGGGAAAFLFSGGQAPADAEALISTVNDLDPRARRVVVYHARTATRPDWNAAPWIAARDREHRWHRLPSADLVRPEVMVLEGGVAVCPIVTHDDRDKARREWRIWWLSLAVMAAGLAGRLGSISTTGPAAPAFPWDRTERIVPCRARLDLTAAERREIAEAGGDGARRAELAERHGLTRSQVRRIIQTEAAR
jgi:hypothetical protein